MTAYRPVPPQVDLPALEREVLDFWREQKIFEKSVARNEGARHLDLLRGPAHRQRPPRHPPHRVAHVQGRLPALPDDAGLPGQPQGRLGLPRPAGRARRREGARVLRQGRHRGLRHRRVQRPLPRVGAALRRPLGADDRPDGLLDRHARSLPDDGPRVRRVGLVGPASRSTARACWSEDYRVAPYCPRCGTGLSDHELAQGYETVTDPSVYVRFPLTSGPYAGSRVCGAPCWSGRRPPGRWCPTRSWPPTPR